LFLLAPALDNGNNHGGTMRIPAHRRSAAELDPQPRGRIGHRLNLPKSDISGQILHAAVGREDDVLFSHVG
jgi:hypothetical protein